MPRWMLEQSQERPGTPGGVAIASPHSTYPGGPGCRAADSCLLVHGYLDSLAEGKGGFGVLQVAKERLEEGAAGAARMGRPDLARRMRDAAGELPQVRTAEQAAALAPRLKDLSNETWELGRRCGGHLSQNAIFKARALSKKVAQGEISQDQAVAELRDSIGGQ